MKHKITLTLISSMFLLTACGGGGSSGSSPAPVTTNTVTLPDGATITTLGSSRTIDGAGSSLITSVGMTIPDSLIARHQSYTISYNVQAANSGSSNLLSSVVLPTVTTQPAPCVIDGVTTKTCVVTITSNGSTNGSYTITPKVSDSLGNLPTGYALPAVSLTVISPSPAPSPTPEPTASVAPTPSTSPSPTPSPTPTASPAPLKLDFSMGHLEVTKESDFVMDGESIAGSIKIVGATKPVAPFVISFESSNTWNAEYGNGSWISPSQCAISSIQDCNFRYNAPESLNSFIYASETIINYGAFDSTVYTSDPRFTFNGSPSGFGVLHVESMVTSLDESGNQVASVTMQILNPTVPYYDMPYINTNQSTAIDLGTCIYGAYWSNTTSCTFSISGVQEGNSIVSFTLGGHVMSIPVRVYR